MARLPEPVIEEINATWPGDSTLREKDFYSILGQAIRKRKEAERRVDKKGIESDLSST